jgi:hypothetical protein
MGDKLDKEKRRLIVGKHAFLHYKYIFFILPTFTLYQSSNPLNSSVTMPYDTTTSKRKRTKSRNKRRGHTTRDYHSASAVQRVHREYPRWWCWHRCCIGAGAGGSTAADDGAGSGDIGAGGVDIGVGAGGSTAGVGIDVDVDVGVGVDSGVGAGDSPALAKGLVISPSSSSFCCLSCLSFSWSSCSFSEPSSSFSLLSFSSSRRRRCQFLLW